MQTRHKTEQTEPLARPRVAEPCRRLMAAVLQTVVDDSRGSAYRQSVGYSTPIDAESAHRAIAYVSSTDRSWPFSFENLCDALGLDIGCLRQQLRRGPDPLPDPSSA